jgi:hypothetical protein
VSDYRLLGASCSATGLQRNMTTDAEIDVDPSGVHINRSCTDPMK